HAVRGGGQHGVASRWVMRAAMASAPEPVSSSSPRPPASTWPPAAGATSVHLSAKSRATPRRAAGWVPLGAGGTSAADDTHFVTDATVVAEARRALDATAGRPGEAGDAPR
ncbi:copper homeostasis protein CutC, partial [Streptomyces sp. NPDC005549]